MGNKKSKKSKKMLIFSTVSSLVLVIAIVTCMVLSHINTNGLAEPVFTDKINDNTIHTDHDNSGNGSENEDEENNNPITDTDGTVVENISIDTPTDGLSEFGEYEAILNDKVILFEDEETKEIYKSIVTIETKTTGVFVEVNKEETALSHVGKGDICVLEDYGDSPFGETYFGKVIDIADNGDTLIYTFDNPTFDEVFDELVMDVSAFVDNDDIGDVMLMDGVSVEYVDDVGVDVALSEDNGHKKVVNIGHSSSSSIKAASLGVLNLPRQKFHGDATAPEVELETSDGIVFTYNIDLIEALGLKKDDGTDGGDDDNTISKQEAYGVKVYRIDTKYTISGSTTEGTIYHKDGCSMLSTFSAVSSFVKTKVESTVGDEVSKEHKACIICKPPVVDSDEDLDGSSEAEWSLNLSGKVGVEDLYYNGKIDWSIFQENLLTDLYVEAGGKIVEETNININGEYTLGGNTTGITLPNGWGKLEGLDEKLFPIACVQFDGTLKPVILSGSNVALRQLNSMVPVSVTFLFYIDIKGNLTISATAGFTYEQDFKYTNTVVRDGKWVWDDDFQSETAKSIFVDASFEFDYDAHIGASLGFYVYNMNVAEIAVAKAGIEGEGKASISYKKEYDGPISGEIANNRDEDPSNDVEVEEQETDTETVETEFDFYNRVYVKFLELNIRLSVQLSLLGIIDFSPSFEESACFIDWTILEWGNREEEEYDAETHKYTAAVAKDDNALYYIDMNKNITKETYDGDKQVLMENVKYICGIDDTYVYVISNNEITDQDCMYRVNKTEGGGRQIEEDIRYVFGMDDEYIYYTTNFDSTMLKRLRRSDLKSFYFSDFDHEVTYAKQHGENMFVSTTEPTNLWFDYHHFYWVDGDGNAGDDLGDGFLETGLAINNGNYKYNVVPISGSMLSSSIGYLSIIVNGQKQVITGNGYSFQDDAIYVVEEPEVLTDDPIRLVRYNPKTGTRTELMELNRTATLFTLYHADDGNWYYLDQVDNEIQVCRTDNAFVTKEIIDTIDADKYGFSLNNCNVVNANGRIYFYQIDGTQVVSIYRLDLQ